MKEYKLKKYYPSLPKHFKNSENIVVVQGDNNMYYIHPSLGSKYAIVPLHAREVEFSPEFWEEVKPAKDYEILSFYSDEHVLKIGDEMTISDEEGSISSIRVMEDFTEYAVGFKVYSIKRLSDGEIFTLGDKVINSIGRVMKVDKLYVNKRGEACLQTDWTSSFTINGIEKAPEALFKTEDGVEIYEGFTVYQVSIVDKKYDMHSISARKEITPIPSYFKYFSTKEAAESYAFLNKPSLSLNDVAKVLHDITNHNPRTTFINEVYDTLKSKIKNK